MRTQVVDIVTPLNSIAIKNNSSLGSIPALPVFPTSPEPSRSAASSGIMLRYELGSVCWMRVCVCVCVCVRS